MGVRQVDRTRKSLQRQKQAQAARTERAKQIRRTHDLAGGPRVTERRIYHHSVCHMALPHAVEVCPGLI